MFNFVADLLPFKKVDRVEFNFVASVYQALVLIHLQLV